MYRITINSLKLSLPLLTLLQPKEIVVKYGGNFPGTYEELRALKGVGDYTASAIASVCFGLLHPVMDGNVIRFISRHFGIESPVNKAATKKEIFNVLMRLMEESEEDRSEFASHDSGIHKSLHPTLTHLSVASSTRL